MAEGRTSAPMAKLTVGYRITLGPGENVPRAEPGKSYWYFKEVSYSSLDANRSRWLGEKRYKWPDGQTATVEVSMLDGASRLAAKRAADEDPGLGWMVSSISILGEVLPPDELRARLWAR